MTWKPALNLQQTAEKFEKKMTVKMIIEPIIKASLRSKIFIVSNYTLSMSMFEYVFTDETQSLLLVGLAKSLVLKK